MASVYFIALPVVWLGVLGPEKLGKDLMLVLGPTFAPVFGSFAKAAAIWFMMFNMFHGTLQPLAGAARTMSQLAEDGLLPRILEKQVAHRRALGGHLLSRRAWLSSSCCSAIRSGSWRRPTSPISSAFVCPTWRSGCCARTNRKHMRPYRAPRGMIVLGLIAATIWIISAVLGFQQFGMKTVLIGVLFAYSGSALYAWRRFSDRRRQGLPGVANTLHIKLTGAMLLVLAFDGAGYLLAVTSLPDQSSALVSVLEDIFVAVAMLSISVGLVLPGILAHAMVQVSEAATGMARGAMASFSNALLALGRGDLDAAHARVDVVPVTVHSGDEVGEMATQRQHAAAGDRACRREPGPGARGTAAGAPRCADRTHHAPRVRAAARSRSGAGRAAIRCRTRCCTWIWITSRSSTTPAAMRRATSCCARSPVCCAPRFATATAWRAWVATNSRCCWKTVPRSPPSASRRTCCKRSRRSASRGSDKMFKIGVSIGLVSFHDGSVGSARADACGRRCLLRREERRAAIASTSTRRRTARWRRGRASWIGWGGCARRCRTAASACMRRRCRRLGVAQGRAPSGTAGAHDRRRAADHRSDGVHSRSPSATT